MAEVPKFICVTVPPDRHEVYFSTAQISHIVLTLDATRVYLAGWDDRDYIELVADKGLILRNELKLEDNCFDCGGEGSLSETLLGKLIPDHPILRELADESE